MNNLSTSIENAYSRAGILFGLIRHNVDSGAVKMHSDDDGVGYDWSLKIGNDWVMFEYFVVFETLGRCGLSLTGLSETIIQHWKLRAKQFVERNGCE